MNRIKIPLKISVGNIRLFQGLTLRQMVWTILGVTIAGLVALSETDLLLKVPVIAIVVGVVFMFAYYKTTDDPLEIWLARRLGFQRSTRGYIFKGHAAQRRVSVDSPRPTAAASSRAAPARVSQPLASASVLAQTRFPLSLAGVVLGFWLVASVSALLIYLVRSARIV